MRSGARVRRMGTAAALLTSVLGTGSVARAQDPAPAVEVFYGASKVWPLPAPPVPPPPQPVVPAEYKGGPVIEEPGRAAAAFESACVAVRDGSKSVSHAATNVLDRIADRMAVQTEARQIMQVSYVPQPFVPSPLTPPATLPWLMPVQSAAPPAPPPTPTVVVIREAATEVPQVAAPVLPPPRGFVMTPELMVAAGFGTLCLMVSMAALMRSSRRERPRLVPAGAPLIGATPPEGGVRLQGKYNAGPVPETAEKFDLGPTYHDELHEKKQVEERNNEAVVQFILDQNMALLDALEPVAEETDDADFEISANN